MKVSIEKRSEKRDDSSIEKIKLKEAANRKSGEDDHEGACSLHTMDNGGKDEHQTMALYRQWSDGDHTDMINCLT